MYLPVVGAVTITCSSIKSKNFCIRMWIIKYIGIVVLNGIVIAKIRITWFDGTEVTMTDVCVWIYIFWNMSHCKGVPSSTAVRLIWIYVTRFNVTHHKVLLNQLFQKLNFPTPYDGRYNAVNRVDPISDEKDDSWDTGIVLEPELKICSKSVPSLFRKSEFPNWTFFYDQQMLKLADSYSKCPIVVIKSGRCSILMFYLEFRVRKLNFQTKRISNGAKLFQVADLVTEEIEGTQEY